MQLMQSYQCSRRNKSLDQAVFIFSDYRNKHDMLHVAWQLRKLSKRWLPQPCIHFEAEGVHSKQIHSCLFSFLCTPALLFFIKRRQGHNGQKAEERLDLAHQPSFSDHCQQVRSGDQGTPLEKVFTPQSMEMCKNPTVLRESVWSNQRVSHSSALPAAA